MLVTLKVEVDIVIKDAFSSALNPNDAFRLFKIVHICNLVKKYYPQDFTKHEQELLGSQLQHYELDVIKHPNF